MEDKIIAYEVGDMNMSRHLNKADDFTTNQNYLGHHNGVPVYYSKFITKGEIKKVMNNQTYENLPEGKYLAKVEQVIRKHGKNANGEEDKTKDVITLELNIKDHNDKFYYKSFCVKGYGDQQMEIANQEIKEILEKFGIEIIEDLKDKEVIVVSKVGNTGFANLYIKPKKNFYDWSNVLKFDGETKFPCTVNKFYKAKTGNKYVFVVNIVIDGKQIEEYIVYDFDKPYKEDSFNYIMEKLGLDPSKDIDTFISKVCLFIIKRVSVNGKTYFNKRLGFEKKAPRKPTKW